MVQIYKLIIITNLDIIKYKRLIIYIKALLFCRHGININKNISKIMNSPNCL